MDTESSDIEVGDNEVMALIQEGKPLSDILKELLTLRRWKERIDSDLAIDYPKYHQLRHIFSGAHLSGKEAFSFYSMVR